MSESRFAAPSELARTCSLSPEMPKGCTPPVTFRTSGKPLAPAVAKHFFCRAQDRFTLSSAPQHKRRFFRGKSMICLRFLLRTQSCCATINQNRSVPSRVSRVRTHFFTAAHPGKQRRCRSYEIRYRRIRAGFIRISASVMKAADA